MIVITISSWIVHALCAIQGRLLIYLYSNNILTMTKTTTYSKRTPFAFAALFMVPLLTIAFALPLETNAALLTQQLDLGMTNSDVTSLQTFLATNSALYPEKIISGYFGELTAAAVSRFQTANGLPPVGRVGPQTLALINAAMTGQPSPGTGADVWAPTIYPESLSTGTNSATISWTTSDAARSRVMYGTSWPFLYALAPSVSSAGYNATSNITLNGLQSRTTYYYVLESIDGSGNIMWTVPKSFMTQ